MTIIVAPDEGYNSYVSVADADVYVADMGLGGWPTVVADKERLLRRATQYIAVRYAPLDRYLDPVHPSIKAAVVEAAIRAPDLWQDVDGQAVIEDTIGPMTTKFSEPINGGQKSFPLIDGLMRGLGSVRRSGVFMLGRT